MHEISVTLCVSNYQYIYNVWICELHYFCDFTSPREYITAYI